MIIDESIAYSKLVPEKQTKASVNSFGGKTVVRNQLYDFYVTGSSNGITYTADTQNKKYTLNGTATANSVYSIDVDSIISGHKYLLFGCPLNDGAASYQLDAAGGLFVDSGNGVIFTATDSKTIRMRVVNGYTATSLVFKPRLVDLTQMFGSGNEPSSVDDERIKLIEIELDANPSYYNTGELVSAEVQQIVSAGKNLLNSNRNISLYGVTGSFSGSKMVLNGTVTASGPEDATGISPIILPAGTYALSVSKISGSISDVPDNLIRFDINTLSPTNYDINIKNPAPIIVTLERTSELKVILRVSNGTVYDNLNLGIQIEKSSTATPYSPYFSNSKPIPSALLTFLSDKGYGWSAETAYNEIDFVNKKYIKRVGSRNMGELSWEVFSGKGQTFITREITDKAIGIGNIICSKYVHISGQTGTTLENLCICGAGSYINVFVRDDNYTSVSSFKTAMNGVMLYYKLATPIEYDISSYLDDDFAVAVESGGTVTFEQQSGGLNLPIYSKVIFLSSVESLQTLQEEHLSDLTLREQFIAYWDAGQFSQAYAILQDSQFDDKAVKAEIFNELTDGIYDLETQSEPTFKQYRIVVSDTPPADLDVGKIYFQTV